MVRALIVGDNFIKSRLLHDSLKEALKKRDIPLEAETIDLGFPIKIKLPSPEAKLSIYDIQGESKEIIPHIKDMEVLIVHLAAVDKEVIEAGKKLKVIGVLRGGPVNVDVKAATRRKIPVLNLKGRNADAVADLTMGLLIAEARSIARAHASLMAGRWRFDFYEETLLGTELAEKTLGLIGFGTIGKKVADRAKGFALKLLVYDPYVTEQEIKVFGVKKVDLDTLLHEADFVSIHARLTEETRGLIDAQALTKMKPTAILVNTARGEIVDEVALYNALKKRIIAGAALDVFTEEPFTYSSLLNLDNVTVTPHIGAATREVSIRSGKMIAEEVAAFLSGNRPKNIVNPLVLSN